MGEMVQRAKSLATEPNRRAEFQPLSPQAGTKTWKLSFNHGTGPLLWYEHIHCTNSAWHVFKVRRAALQPAQQAASPPLGLGLPNELTPARKHGRAVASLPWSYARCLASRLTLLNIGSWYQLAVFWFISLFTPGKRCFCLLTFLMTKPSLPLLWVNSYAAKRRQQIPMWLINKTAIPHLISHALDLELKNRLSSIIYTKCQLYLEFSVRS